MILRLIVSSSLAMGTIATAAEPPASGGPHAEKGNVREEKICETIAMLGSRINKKRFCGTRAEWEEKRLRDRQELEKAQMGACVRDGGC